jgi:iron-sulfur cluster assembly accessory protein
MLLSLFARTDWCRYDDDNPNYRCVVVFGIIYMYASAGGCNGYSYTMDYALQSDDLKKYEQVESHGVKVFVDPPAIFYILGTEMDYVETALSTEFTFVNPNSKGECGCGESFNV